MYRVWGLGFGGLGIIASILNACDYADAFTPCDSRVLVRVGSW